MSEKKDRAKEELKMTQDKEVELKQERINSSDHPMIKS